MSDMTMFVLMAVVFTIAVSASFVILREIDVD